MANASTVTGRPPRVATAVTCQARGFSMSSGRVETRAAGAKRSWSASSTTDPPPPSSALPDGHAAVTGGRTSPAATFSNTCAARTTDVVVGPSGPAGPCGPGRALRTRRTPGPVVPVGAWFSLWPRRAFGTCRPLRTDRTLWPLQARWTFWPDRAEWTFRALWPDRTQWTLRPDRAEWTFRALWPEETRHSLRPRLALLPGSSRRTGQALVARQTDPGRAPLTRGPLGTRLARWPCGTHRSLLALVPFLRLQAARLGSGGRRRDDQPGSDSGDEQGPGHAQHHCRRHSAHHGAPTQASHEATSNSSHLRRVTHARRVALQAHESIPDIPSSSSSSGHPRPLSAWGKALPPVLETPHPPGKMDA